MLNNLKLKYLVLLLASGFFQTAQAVAINNLPTGNTTIIGTTDYTGSTSTLMKITTSTARTLINVTSGNVISGHTVQVIQPNSASATMFKVTGTEASTISGNVISNATLFWINPNGFIFSGTASINVPSFVASTLDISNGNFENGKFLFEGSSTQSITNDGGLTLASGQKLILIGRNVTNNGTINAPGGQVWLAAGSSLTVADVGSPELSFTYNATDGQVVNLGSIAASGGIIGLLGNTVANRGTLDAGRGKVIIKSAASQDSATQNQRITDAPTATRLTTDQPRSGTPTDSNQIKGEIVATDSARPRTVGRGDPEQKIDGRVETKPDPDQGKTDTRTARKAEPEQNKNEEKTDSDKSAESKSTTRSTNTNTGGNNVSKTPARSRVMCSA